MASLVAVRRFGALTGRGAAGVLGGVLAVPARVGRGAEQALDRLEHIAVGVQAMHSEFVGMREDIRRLNDGVRGLRTDIAGLREGVGQVEANTEGLDPRLEALGTSLHSVELLATRLGRFGRRTP